MLSASESATVLLAEQTAFIFPQQQMTRMQFLMVWGAEKGGQGGAVGPLQRRGWSLPSWVVSCHPCWAGEGAVDSDSLS